jgi:hypothetical protein
VRRGWRPPAEGQARSRRDATRRHFDRETAGAKPVNESLVNRQRRTVVRAIRDDERHDVTLLPGGRQRQSSSLTIPVVTVVAVVIPFMPIIGSSSLSVGRRSSPTPDEQRDRPAEAAEARRRTRPWTKVNDQAEGPTPNECFQPKVLVRVIDVVSDDGRLSTADG